MHRAIWAVKRAHWWTWMKARRMLRAQRENVLTPARFDVLLVLKERGKMMQSELQRVLNVVASTMSEMLRDLERSGFVARGTRSRAGRSVELSAVGDDALGKSFMAYFDIDDVVGSAFGDWDWDVRADVRLLIWERVCRRVRHACGDRLFARAFGWLEEPAD